MKNLSHQMTMTACIIQVAYPKNDQTYLSKIHLYHDDDVVHYRRVDNKTGDVLVYFEDLYVNRIGWSRDFDQWQNVSGELNRPYSSLSSTV